MQLLLLSFGFLPFSRFLGILILITALSSPAVSQVRLDGGRVAGLGQAAVAIIRGPEAILANPAGLSLPGRHGLAFFSTRLFGLRELTYSSVALSYPAPIGVFGGALQNFGYSLYKEQTISVAWAQKFRERFAVGEALRIITLRIPGYGSRTCLTTDVGFCIIATPTLTFGLSITNLLGCRWFKETLPLPQITRLGLSFKPAKGLLLTSEIFKDPRFPIEIRGGCEILILSCLCLRIGFTNPPSTFCGGTGISWKRWIVDYAFCIHTVLGPTHQISFRFVMKQR